MNRPVRSLSPRRLRRLRAQDYTCQTDAELEQLAFGIRFPFRFCAMLVIIALLTQSVVLFAFMLVVSFFGMILSNHPLDYVYNGLIAPALGRPVVPRRCVQIRFACAIATVWLTTIVILLSTGAVTAALSMAVVLAVLALLPSTIDYCVPTAIYNALFARDRTFAYGEGCS